MSTRSILGLIYMVQGLQQLGHDPEPILQRHGLSMAQLDPTTRMERSRELRIYADISDSVQDPLIGLKLGGFYGLAGYGPLVMLLMTCAKATLLASRLRPVASSNRERRTMRAVDMFMPEPPVR